MAFFFYSCKCWRIVYYCYDYFDDAVEVSYCVTANSKIKALLLSFFSCQLLQDITTRWGIAGGSVCVCVCCVCVCLCVWRPLSIPHTDMTTRTRGTPRRPDVTITKLGDLPMSSWSLVTSALCSTTLMTLPKMRRGLGRGTCMTCGTSCSSASQ